MYIINFIKKNWPYLGGGIAGGIGGYIYWYFTGCASGACPITSSPVMSVILGALLGSLLFSMIFARNIQRQVNFRELMNNGALLIDVRTREEYAEGHIEDSKNIPLDELSSSLQTFNKEQTYIIVCASGMRSAKAVNLMKINGFTNCYNGGSWLNFKL